MDFGFGRSCAVHTSGLVTCRGDGRPVHTLPGITDAVGVVIHYQEVCAWTRSGAVRCKLYADDTPAAAAPFPDGVMQMAASGERCALLRTGDVYCDRPARGSPLTPEHDAVELAVGSGVHCVRHRSGAVSCARHNYRTADSVLRLPEPTQTRQLTLLGKKLCILLTDASTRCWDLSGDGPFKATEAHLPPLPPFASLARGDRFHCGLSDDGGVTCWGNHYRGQLGVNLARDNRVETVRGIDDAESVFAGSDSACARRQDGSTWCWGDNRSGQLSDGRPASVPLPGQPWHLPGVRQVALADDRTCALLADGTITCWGSRAIWTRPTPARAPGPANYLVTSHDFDCALLRSGEIACRTAWPASDWYPHPADGWWTIPRLAEVVTFQVSHNSLAALLRDGSLKHWDLRRREYEPPLPERFEGVELRTMLGAAFVRTKDGGVACVLKECPDVRPLTDIVAIATSYDTFCALDAAGSLQCVRRESRDGWFQVPGSYAALASSDDNFCALGIDRRSVYCWGRATFGRLSRPESSTPLQAANIAELPAPAETIAVSDEHVCVTFSGERLTCWGANDWGQLGNGKAGTQIGPAPYPQR